MRVNVALFASGGALVLAGVAMWSVPAALILAGLPCIGLGLLRTEAAKATKAAGKSTVQRHRRARGMLRLVPPLRRAS